MSEWTAEEVLASRRNIFCITYNILKAIHELGGHPNTEEMFLWLESPLIQDFALKLLLLLVVNNCTICNNSQ